MTLFPRRKINGQRVKSGSKMNSTWKVAKQSKHQATEEKKHGRQWSFIPLQVQENRFRKSKILTDGTIRFSSPEDFNDVFDSSPAYCHQSILELYKRRPDLIKRIGDAQGLSPAQRLMKKQKYIHNALKAVESGEFGRGIVNSVGVFCVSRTPCSPLMWAHYADDHKGFFNRVSYRHGRSKKPVSTNDPASCYIL